MLKLFIDRDDLRFNFHLKLPENKNQPYEFPLLAAITNPIDEVFNLLIYDPRFVVIEKDIKYIKKHVDLNYMIRKRIEILNG